MIRRRSFLTHLGAGITGIGTVQLGGVGSWQPARHEQDEWLDKIPGQHRFIFDTIAPEGFGSALMFANNYFIANKNGYGLQDSDLAVVIVARHNSTAMAFNDAIWAKYGSILSAQLKVLDPKTKQAPTTNVYYGAGSNSGATIEALVKRGVHFAVCQMATRVFAGRIAREAKAETEAIYKEVSANLVGNSHLVPAGIVAVNRAQEHGYTFVTA